MKDRQNFWSRRKQAVEAEAEAEVAEQVAVEEQQAEDAQEAKTDTEILDELGLQDPDTLEAGDDFSAFMAKAVPTRLRNRALRKLWLSNPALANLDMLLDYGEDFTTSADAVEVIQTTYQVGKGLLAHVQEMERQEEAAKLKADMADALPAKQEDPEILEDNAPDEALQALVEDANTALDAEDTAEEVMVTYDDDFESDMVFASKKRMRFAFEAQG